MNMTSRVQVNCNFCCRFYEVHWTANTNIGMTQSPAPAWKLSPLPGRDERPPFSLKARYQILTVFRRAIDLLRLAVSSSVGTFLGRHCPILDRAPGDRQHVVAGLSRQIVGPSEEIAHALRAGIVGGRSKSEIAELSA